MNLDPHRRNVVAIGASAGGVEALQGFFSHLPPQLPAAILVVLHIPAHTRSELHHVLRRHTAMPVAPAQDGQPLQPGRVYVAPADRHLMVGEQGIRLSRGPKECRVRPAVDALFRSTATTLGPRAVGVVLSGTLDDGTAGLWAIKDRGGLAFVQDPAEAVYDGMPRSAIEHVRVDEVAGVQHLAQRLPAVLGQPVTACATEAPRRQRIENEIALTGEGLRAGVMSLGAVSQYTCPDCHGVLVQIEEGEEGSIVRFRCHTGHAFSLQTLVAEVNAAVDEGLWDTLRAIEERILLLRQTADLAERSSAAQQAARLRAQADDAERRLQPLRDMVLDPRFFGHDPAA